MFVAVYSFKVWPNCEQDFIRAWEDMTRLIYRYEGSLGSRLHKNGPLTYIAYAQWPDKNTWENSGSNLPASAAEIRITMREACEHIETLYALEVVSDMLKGAGYSM